MSARSNGLQMNATVPKHEGQFLLIDADDTLWENNIYFEQAIDAFIDFLDHSTMEPDRVRLVLQEIELSNLDTHGYGSNGFSQSLQLCFERLTERSVSDDDIETILGFANQILLQEIDLLPGVAATLPRLAERHPLVMFTKGSKEEQQRKIDRSGIDGHFLETIIVWEKHESAYHDIVRHLDWDPAATWMIGNSPRSDINPALAAGLNAVFIPHESTWSLERQELRHGPGKLLELSSFADLLHHF